MSDPRDEDPARISGWDREHLYDPRDTAESYVELEEPKLPGFDLPPADWKTLAEEYRREAQLLA